jgi:hypothetical protein
MGQLYFGDSFITLLVLALKFIFEGAKPHLVSDAHAQHGL